MQVLKSKEDYREKHTEMLTLEKSIDQFRGRVVQRLSVLMALKHGNKTYMQLLLDPNRADLVATEAEKEGIRPSAWVRKVIYNKLETSLPSSVYKEAEAKDEVVWRESVRKRIEGRSSAPEKPPKSTTQ